MDRGGENTRTASLYSSLFLCAAVFMPFAASRFACLPDVKLLPTSAVI